MKITYKRYVILLLFFFAGSCLEALSRKAVIRHNCTSFSSGCPTDKFLKSDVFKCKNLCLLFLLKHDFVEQNMFL